MAKAIRQIKRPLRGRSSRTAIERPEHRLPHRPSDPPGRGQDALLRDGFLRGLHPDVSARKGLHLSALCVEGGLAGQASHRQADAPEGRGLYREGDRSESEGGRRADHERIHAGRFGLTGDEFVSSTSFGPLLYIETHA